MTLAQRLVGLLLEEPQRRQATAGFAAPTPPTRSLWAVVLASPQEAHAAACAVGLALAAQSRQSIAIAATWGGLGDEIHPAGALPAAGRVAARVRDTGLDAVAAGRLARVELEGDEPAVAAGIRRLLSQDVPCAIALAGARGDLLTELLGEADVVVVVPAGDGPDGLTEVALADASTTARSVVKADLRLTAPTRALLCLGYVAPPWVTSQLRDIAR
ncbi:MAG TPA: hypothetical protein VNT22_00560 [Baekduia sp.]|nr:hypothetical protein [Baekduia sp.]